MITHQSKSLFFEANAYVKLSYLPVLPDQAEGASCQYSLKKLLHC